jgi:serine/threonine protein kinase
MSILYCLNPECSHPQNPTHYSYCQGCGGNLSQTSQSYSFHSRYLIVGVLGEGAFGRTYQAKDLNFNRKPRVIKKFIAQMQGSALEKSKELFQREAEKLDELKHEQIPTVYDYFSAGNSLYLVQEFIEGETLLQEYQREGRFSEQKIKEILQQLLPVLVYLHSKGLIHRDIKPDNLMRRRSDGKLMLIDFGGIKEQTSQMGTGLYTPGYAAYEHIMGSAVAASDLYSLAATCVRLLTGCFPQSNNNLPDPVYDVDERKWLWQSVLKSQKRSISDFLANLLNKMLEDKSSRRYQSASEVLTALNNLPSSVTIVQPPPKTTIRSGITRRKWLYNSVGMIVFGGAIGLAIYSMANYNLGDKQGAIADYNQAIKLNPNFAFPYNNRGWAKYNLGDKQGAIADYNQAIKLNPDFAVPYYNRGLIYKELNDNEKAIKDFRQAAKLHRQQNNQTWYQNSLDRLKELGVSN